MPEYLTKEEIKQWRSSLEKITLEEYAARLGKVLEEQKHTNDLIDIVMRNQPVVSKIESPENSEKISSIKPVSKPVIKEQKPVEPKPQKIKEEKLKVKKTEEKPEKQEKQEKMEKKENKQTLSSSNDNATYSGIEFEKPLTEREQKVFEMFYKHKGEIVYAKDLADLLSLPRDYVYKYIKTLRAKIKGDKLENADKGGYVLKD